MASESASPWPPTTEDALDAAAREGNLRETHHVELKRELPSGDKGNRELAADLASLAIDGGTLFIGVDESAGPGLSPVPLKGLAERVEQVALSRIDGQLRVSPVPIVSANDPTTGYLMVRIPASPRAPHMVEHRYWGRNETTKYELSDGEVERLMRQRDLWAASAKDMLRDWMANERLLVEGHTNGHLFVVARQVPRREGILLPTFSREWRDVLRRLVSETSHHSEPFVPDMPSDLYNFSRTPDGWSWSSYAVFGERQEGDQPKDREDRAIFLEVCEDAGLRLWCGRATYRQGAQLYLLDPLILGLTSRMVGLARGIGRLTNFYGNWDFGVGITGLNNARFYVQYGFSTGPLYTQPSYLSTTRASTPEIGAGEGPILEQLLGRLMRAVDADEREAIKKQFAPPTT